MMVQCFQSQDRYEQLLANSATAVICADANSVIVSWNSAAEKLFGHSADHAVGELLSIIIPHEQRAAHEAGLAHAVKAGKARLEGRSTDILALHANGDKIAVGLSLSMWFEQGKPMFGALIRDIADRLNAQRRLEYLAHCDPLTSLPNRHAMHSKIAEVMHNCPSSLLLLDLDGFKDVNDSLGHSAGDQLLAEVAGRLRAAVADEGFVARLGGDEFAILISDCVNPLKVDEVTNRIFECLRLPFQIAGQCVFIGTSIGIAMAPYDAADVEQLLSRADLALYSSKKDGGGKRTFFAAAMQSTSEQRRRLSIELRQALLNDEFEIWYQPQFSMDDFRLAGVEALLRWRHPVHGLLLPQIFMKVLEGTAIAEEVGDWIIDQACAAAANWRRGGFETFRVGVNLFPAQLRSGRLFDVVSSALTRHDIGASQLEIEITENTVLSDDRRSVLELKKLRSLGVGIAFDDFGTGFASLSLLQKYPLTRLKIDRTFVAKVDKEAGDEAIVTAVIGMANSLGLSVIAEGVETAQQEAVLARLGCDEVQGYLYGRAMPAREISQRWVEWTNERTNSAC